MRQDVRKTTPFTTAEAEQLRVFSRSDSWEHQALEQLSPVPLRGGSEGAVVRALALLGMAYVRDHAALADNLPAGYAELATVRAQQSERASETARTSGLRTNMARRAATSSATTK